MKKLMLEVWTGNTRQNYLPPRLLGKRVALVKDWVKLTEKMLKRKP